MFGFAGRSGDLFYPALYLDTELLFFLIVGVVFSFPIIPAIKKWLEDPAGNLPGRVSKIKRLILDPGVVILSNLFWIAVLLISIIFLVAGNYQPFIYSRF